MKTFLSVLFTASMLVGCAGFEYNSLPRYSPVGMAVVPVAKVCDQSGWNCLLVYDLQAVPAAYGNGVTVWWWRNGVWVR